MISHAWTNGQHRCLLFMYLYLPTILSHTRVRCISPPTNFYCDHVCIWISTTKRQNKNATNALMLQLTNEHNSNVHTSIPRSLDRAALAHIQPRKRLSLRM